MKAVLKGLREYVNDDKLLLDYVYAILKLYDKYGSSLYNYINQISIVDTKLSEIVKFFKEEKYKRKDIYVLLQDLIKETGYNIYEVKKSDNIQNDIVDLANVADIVEDVENNDVGIYVKSADSKIYKRFLLQDVKKILGLN